MKTMTTILLLALLCLNLNAQEHMRGRLLVSFNNNVRLHVTEGGKTFGNAAADALNERYGCTGIHIIRQRGNSNVYLLHFPETVNLTQLAEAYMATGIVRFSEPDYIATSGGTAPNDTLFTKQWGLYNDGSFAQSPAKTGADINILDAWDVEDGDTSVIVAVMDSGIKTDHPDLKDRLWRNHAELPNSLDDDNNGYVDDTLGYNFAYGGANVTDDNGHGTHVSGIIGAGVNNTTGYAGVDQHCRIMTCKAADNTGFFSYSWMTEAIYYAVDMKANVINISAGGAVPSNIVGDALNHAMNNNIVVVVAMMNAGSSQPFYPASHAGVIAVGATGPDDTATSFSNYGNHISVVAPGHYIYGLSHNNDTAVGAWGSGTSQAAPHVAGIASLLLAQDKNRTPAQIKSLIETNAEDLVGGKRDVLGWDKYYGYGRVNAHRALTNAALTAKDVQRETGVKIFPNPARETLYIGNAKMKGGTVTIVNATGAVVYSSTMNAALHAVDIRSFAKGNYFVSLEKGNEKISETIVVN
jgi:subtilisin family serine protease